MSNSSIGNHYASRYLVTVHIENKYIMLEDANRGRYYIDMTMTNVVEQFKIWFKTVFSKGIAHKLTVFEYREVEHDNQIDFIIQRFFNLSDDDRSTDAKYINNN